MNKKVKLTDGNSILVDGVRIAFRDIALIRTSPETGIKTVFLKMIPLKKMGDITQNYMQRGWVNDGKY